MTKYQIVYEACKEATKKRIKFNSQHFSRDKMIQMPEYLCCFRAVDVDQDAINNLVPYLRRHHKKMGLKPLHNAAECARYMFVVPPFREKLMDSALREEEK